MLSETDKKVLGYIREGKYLDAPTTADELNMGESTVFAVLKVLKIGGFIADNPPYKVTEKGKHV